MKRVTAEMAATVTIVSLFINYVPFLLWYWVYSPFYNARKEEKLPLIQKCFQFFLLTNCMSPIYRYLSESDVIFLNVNSYIQHLQLYQNLNF